MPCLLYSDIAEKADRIDGQLSTLAKLIGPQLTNRSLEYIRNHNLEDDWMYEAMEYYDLNGGNPIILKDTLATIVTLLYTLTTKYIF